MFVILHCFYKKNDHYSLTRCTLKNSYVEIKSILIRNCRILCSTNPCYGLNGVYMDCSSDIILVSLCAGINNLLATCHRLNRVQRLYYVMCTSKSGFDVPDRQFTNHSFFRNKSLSVVGTIKLLILVY